MPSSPNRPLIRFGLALALATGACTAASAQGTYGGYGPGYGSYGGYGGYGFAEPAIRGEYIGAPYTRFPRPSEIVPAAWGYGTYGIPTVAGIQRAPVGTPTVYVLDAPPPIVRSRASARSRILNRGGDGRWSQAEAGLDAPAASSGARVIPVSVPRR